MLNTNQIKSLFLSVLVFTSFAVSNANAHKFDGIIAFGDSLSCNGNACIHAEKPSTICNLYPQGRFTDGDVWLEVLSDSLGFERPTPSLAGGNNFAFGGATTGWQPSPHLLNVGHQIESYLKREGGRADPRKLFVIWAGGNDIKNEIVPINLISNMKQHIADLAKSGARTFLVPNFPPLGRTPIASGALSAVGFGLGKLGEYFELVPSADAFHKDFASLTGGVTDKGIEALNVLLESALVDLENSFNIKIYRMDAYSNFHAVREMYDEKDLFLYDFFHPSAFAHGLIAQEAYNALN